MNEYTHLFAMPTVALFNCAYYMYMYAMLCMSLIAGFMYLYEPHMTSYSLTDIEDVGIFVQNNQKTINGLYKGENIRIREREREREKERE